MDSSTNQSLINTSLAVMSNFLPNQIVSFSASILNIACCTFTIVIISKRPLMKTRGFQLIKYFLSNDLSASCLMFLFNMFHLWHNATKIPELTSTRRCFAIFGLQYLLITNNGLLSLFISIDRLISVRWSRFYRHSMPEWLNVCFVSVSTVISSLVYVLGLFDRFPQNYVFYCTARGSTGFFFSFYYWIITSIFTGLTCVVYVILLIFVKVKIAPSSVEVTQQKNTLAKKKSDLANKVTRVVAFTTICYMAIGPVQNFLTAILTVYVSPDLVLVIGTYFGIIAFLEGSIYTLCLVLFVEDFRCQFKSMIGFS